jgi:bifunctional non-homologous end joining protein LigD
MPSMWLRTSRAARERQRRTAKFIVPCQAILPPRAPNGSDCMHEIKQDGYRLLAAKRGGQVKLWSR